jgi:hypothetical protein
MVPKITGLSACHYLLTAEELDFILKCDIKYRRGRNAEIEEE